MHTGLLIAGLEATVDKRIAEIQIPEFVLFDECAETAKRIMTERHPDMHLITGLGNAFTTFCITFATIVAYECASEATRRANKKEKPCATKVSSTDSISPS